MREGVEEYVSSYTPPMRFDVLTLLPEVCAPYLNESILKRAQENQLISIHLHNLRDYATDKHKVTDDVPYGGGGGMVLKPEPVFAAVESILRIGALEDSQIPIIMMTPQGRPFTQAVAKELIQHKRLVLMCGRYEGFDERIRQHLATDEISIGDFVLTGGELAALMVVDAVARLLPGVLGDPTGADDDSFASGLLEYPHYTRPAEFRGWRVPEALQSGDHARIARWRQKEALKRTFLRRPDMLAELKLTEDEKLWLAQVAYELAGQPKPN